MDVALRDIKELEKSEILKEYRSLLRAARPNIQKSEIKLIRRAFEMAAKAHDGMRRKSGEPYILHPLAVAKIVAKEVGLGATSIICALLHDTVEDTHLSLHDITNNFDSNIAKIIDGLTKIKGVTSNTSAIAQQAENLKKILLTMSEDVRVIVIKIADRLHNMRTLKSMPESKQMRISSETLFLYAPLAHRLGLYAIKTELEDLSLKYTRRDLYLEIAKKLDATRRDRNAFIRNFIDPLKKRLEEGGLSNFEIYGRPKSIHSIWNKIRTKKVAFEDIYDLFAIRIIIDSPPELEKSDCWKAYSIITDLYTPNSNRLRDWISTPKSNGYESLHVTVMGPEGKWVEVQIRTHRMNLVAERGVAAHWKYKGVKNTDNALDNWLEKVRDYLQDPAANAVDFMTDFQHNLYENDLYVFTPRGDLKTLQAKSTILDFAFEIHTEIGCSCIGGKINNKLLPISHQLTNGDQVEILTSKKQKPTEDWLTFAVTSRARSKIKTFLKEERRIQAEDGKMLFERKLKQLKHLKIPSNKQFVEELVAYFKQNDSLNFFYNVAIKKFDLNELKKITFINGKVQSLDARKPEVSKEEELHVNNVVNPKVDILIFSGLDNVDYSTAKCCDPKPGDEVFGFITISSGIKIHQAVCPNAPEMTSRYPYRIVKTKWAKQKGVAFLTGLKITGIDDVGLVNKLTSVISGKLKLDMRSLSFDTKDNVFEGQITVYVNNNAVLKKLISEVKRVEGVYSVSRYKM